jgi:hypothetical protein
LPGIPCLSSLEEGMKWRQYSLTLEY